LIWLLSLGSKVSKDFPFFDLGSLCVATDNFSDSNMLGQGGFGPVYKVNGIQVFSTIFA
jgi:hypothetical protein